MFAAQFLKEAYNPIGYALSLTGFGLVQRQISSDREPSLEVSAQLCDEANQDRADTQSSTSMQAWCGLEPKRLAIPLRRQLLRGVLACITCFLDNSQAANPFSMFSGASHTREPHPISIKTAHQACLLMLNVRGVLRSVIMTVGASSLEQVLSATSWSFEGLEDAVYCLDQLIRPMTEESLYFSTSAATNSLVQAHTGG